MGKSKIKMVYCPNCGKVVEAARLNCPHCRESLHNAAEADSNEEKTHKRRMHRDKRERRRQARRDKRAALFEKLPFFEPLYYGGIGVAIITALILIGKLFTISEVAGASVVLVLFVPLYAKYSVWVIDNLGNFGSSRLEKAMLGFVVGGAMVIISLLCLIVSLAVGY